MSKTHRSQTFRVFVSSTFADFELERNALQERVFPRLRAHCEERGFRFEPIDLRWGVNEEAGLDQQTMRICLGELVNCQRISPRPNFIILAGNRYGWRPLPFEIESDEFEQLMHHLTAEDIAKLRFDESRPQTCQGEGNGWYRLDNNAVPPSYVLLPRRVDSKYADQECWQQEEAVLHKILRSAAAIEFPDSIDGKRAKYFHSATHEEIQAGLFANPEAKDHVFAYLRGLETDPTVVDKRQDASATMIQVLKESIANHLDEDHIYRYPETSKGINGDQINAFCERVGDDLKRIISEEITFYESISEHESENELHRAFAEERSSHFVGREKPLKAIADYIVSDSSRPFFVHGVSGSGKTALLAKAWQRTDGLADHSLARFISATPKSGNLKNLLTDLCHQLELHFEALGQDVKSENTSISDLNINSLNRYFESLLQRNPAEKRLIIFIDAIDQLGTTTEASIQQALSWLPRQLPVGVRVIISALDRSMKSSEVSRHYQLSGQVSEFAKRYYSHSTHLNLPVLTLKNARDLLRNWLSVEGRSLTKAQETVILSAFKIEGLPLWLRLTIDIAKRWNSFTSIPRILPGDIYDLITMRMEQLRQERYHGRLLVDKTLGYLHAAVNGLSTTELLDVLAQDEEYWNHFTRNSHHEHKKRQIPVVLWARLHADVATYLTERKADGSILHTIYHRVIAEWISTNVSTSAYHYELSRYFSDQALYLDSKIAGADAIPNLRKLNELIPQQINAEAWDDLTGDTKTPSPLTDLRFTKAKCEAGLGYELSMDYEAAYDVLPELAEEQSKEDKTRQESRKYGEDIAKFSRQSLAGRNPVLPVPPGCSKVSNGLLLGVSIGKTTTNSLPTRAERLQYFGNFYSAHQHILLADPQLTFLQAYNQATDGVVSEQAGSLLSSCKNLWIARTLRPQVPPIRPVGHTILDGHKKEVNAVALNADGTRALSGAADNTVRLWDTQSGACLAVLEGHTKGINAVSFSADNVRALSGSWDQTLRIWDLNHGVCVEKLEVQSSTATLSACGTLALCGVKDNTLQLLDIESKECITSFVGHTKRIKDAALSTDNTRVLSGSSDSTLRLWDASTGRCITIFEEHSAEVTSVAFSADGRHALSGSRDKTLRFWDTQSERCVMVMKGHSEAILTVALSADGMRAISGSEDKTLRLWDTETGDCIAVLEGHADYVVAASMNVNGYLAISAGSYVDRTLRLWEIEKGNRRVALEGHAGIVQKVSFSTDFNRAVSASWDTTLKVWDSKTGNCLATLEGHTDTVWTTVFSPDRSKVASVSWDDSVRLWDARTGNLLSLLKGHNNKAWDVAFSLDGKHVISCGGDKVLRIWDTESDDCVVLKGHADDVTRLEVSSDGSRILSGSIDNTLRIWSIKTGDCLAVLEGHTNSVEDLAWSPNCRFVLSGSADQTLRIWDVESGVCQAVLKGHTSRIKVVVWGDDGKCVLSGAGVGDHTLRLWDSESGHCLTILKGHTNTITDAALSIEGDYVCSCSLDSTLRIWDAKTGVCLAKYHAGAPINSLDIDFEKGSIVCACSDGQIHFLTIKNFENGHPQIIDSEI